MFCARRRSFQQAGVIPLDFEGRPTEEPVVLAWMPAVSLYFHDPDGNLLEFLAMLEDSACLIRKSQARRAPMENHISGSWQIIYSDTENGIFGII
jgi:hypothetical protein